jgi:hypothetical protein
LRYINVETINGIQQEEVYNIYDFPYYELSFAPICTGKQKTFYNIACTFDIESTTIEPPFKIVNGKKKYEVNPYSFMYQWQFCIMGKVIFGRTWEEFQFLLRNIRSKMKLSNHMKLAIYVHNLSYEFQFIKEFIKLDKIFARTKRKVMKATTKDGFEFRCSYFLSNMSLAKFCENTNNVTHYKLVDQFDYKKIRTPKTPLTELEEGYCYNDVKGLAECIEELIRVDDTIATIPLTNTGYVRREFRQAVNTNKKNHENFKKTALTAEQYTMLSKAFRGGNTHANRFTVNTILDDIHSFDISSSYPSAMMMDEYPIGKFSYCTIEDDRKLDFFMQNYCCVFDVTFYDIFADNNNVIPYIDIAHCYQQKKIVNDNGRVLSADMVSIICTNIDLEIILDTYTFGDNGYYEINTSMYAEKGKLPEEFRNKVLEYFVLKTQLKGIDSKDYEYMKSKNRLNSSYGMSVTAIVHSNIEYDKYTMEWSEIVGDTETELINFYKSRNNFLPYQWGVFVTANARKRLQTMLNVVGRDVIYTDTDSIKFKNKIHIAEFEEINRQLMLQAETNDIPAYCDRIDMIEDKEVTTRFHLGTWDNDGEYIRFKTLGSKKYCYEKYKKDKKTGENKKIFEITVSGMSKKKGSEKVGKIENFVIGGKWNEVGRSTSWYNDEEIHQIVINGDKFTTASNIGILDTTYELGVTSEYWDIISENEDIY